MDAFHILTRGGDFDKKRFRNDIQRFQKTGSTQNNIPGPSRLMPESLAPSALPTELDFFKFTQRSRDAEVKPQTDPPNRGTKRKLADVNEDPQANVATKQRIVTKGNNPPEASESFKIMKERYNFPETLLENLECFGFHTPTGIQSQGCPVMFEGRDLAAVSPTGTGKTIAYLLPIFSLLEEPAATSGKDLAHGVRAVVLVPTNELARQIHNECLKLAQGRKWRIILFSKATASTLSDRETRQKIDLIISTPLRLMVALQSGTIELTNVRHVVLDEADRLLDSEFLEQTKEIVAACTHPSTQKAVFSATLPAGVEKVAMEMLQDPVRIVVGLKDTPLPLIAQSLTYVHSDASKLLTLVDYLGGSFNPPILVFVSTQTRAASLTEQLVVRGVRNVDCFHAGLTNKQRQDSVHRMLAGLTWVLVTTEVMARGMDFKGVRGVVNYDFPTSLQSYVHRIGRTGRAGRGGIAITYFTDEDAPFLKPIANLLLQSDSPAPEWMLKLPKPSKLKRRLMGKVARPNTVSSAASVGKSQSIRRRDMVAGSKRRKAKHEVLAATGVTSDDNSSTMNDTQ